MDKKRKILGDSHPDTLLNSTMLSDIYLRCGRVAEATALADRVLTKLKEIEGHEN